MSKLFYMTKRNCMVFLKDTAAVFASLISMIIVLVLMGVFLGEMNVESVVNLLNTYGGVRDAVADRANAECLSQYWTLAGLVVVNSLTVTLTVLGTMVTDKAGDKAKSFYTAPVNKFAISLSYILAAVIIGFVFCMITFLGYMGYILTSGGEVLGIKAILAVMVLTFLNVVLFSVIMYLCAMFVKSTSAWGGVATIVGTLVGFLGAIYVPVGSLPTGVVNFLECLPILHATSLMRKVMCADALECTFTNLPEQVMAGYREAMGIDIFINSEVVNDEFQLLFLGICGIITLVVIALVARKKRNL